MVAGPSMSMRAWHFPSAIQDLRKRESVVLFSPALGVTTSYAFLPASSTKGSDSSTPGSSEYPKIRSCLVALMLANIATQDFHGGPAAEVESHLTLGL